MKIPVIRGVIDRRILVNYRVDPEVLAPLLPDPFRPKLVGGRGVAGVCLIRLKQVRPRLLPAWLGTTSENAAHRFAIEWEENGTLREGVYIPRRDTGSRLNALAGGRIFPGRHHHARFTVHESQSRFCVALASDDGATRISVRARRADRWSPSRLFATLQEASAFFQAGSLGFSPTADPARLEGLELRCGNWQVEPLVVDELQSGYFDDPALFPPGTIEFDCALLMRGIEHQWHAARSPAKNHPCENKYHLKKVKEPQMNLAQRSRNRGHSEEDLTTDEHR